MMPVLPTLVKPDLARIPGRLFDGDGAERTASDDSFAKGHIELLMVNEPCLVIPDLEKLRVELGAGPAARAQAVINRWKHS